MTPPGAPYSRRLAGRRCTIGDQNARGCDGVVVVTEAQASGGFPVGGRGDRGFWFVAVVAVVCEGHNIETRVCCSPMIPDTREQLRNVEDIMHYDLRALTSSSMP